MKVPHRIYVEPFGGGGSVLFHRWSTIGPAELEVFNDINPGVVSFFRQVKEESDFRAIQDGLFLTPISREIWSGCRKAWDEKQSNAYDFYVKHRQSFSGEGTTWFVNRLSGQHRHPVFLHGSAWLSTLARLPRVHRRLSKVVICKKDWWSVVSDYDGPETFIYLDPPYAHATRTERGNYDFEMTNRDHKAMIRRLLTVQGYVLLSGYIHPFYKRLERNGWARVDIDVACTSIGRTYASKLAGVSTAKSSQHQRVESLWLSPNLSRYWGKS